MSERLGRFIGDKIGAVSGKLRSDRYWLRWPGRQARTIRRARRRGGERGARLGRIAGWFAAGLRWFHGIFF